MIKVEVKLSNDYDSTWEEITVIKEEILDLALEKAMDKYSEGHWTKSFAFQDIKLEMKA